ncbi:MAG: pilus assembly protein [Lachnospiraceae bacterium]|nr:pilus assembly protein [Lachnospiraceae bacterium]
MFKLFRKKQKGSLTVEAALVFPLVIISLLFIANILNICMVHMCMQQALNNTAKKISQDSYLIYRFAGEENYTNFIDNLNKIDENYDEFESKATETKDALNSVQKSIKDVAEGVETLRKTPEEFMVADSSGTEEKKHFDILKLPNFCEKLVNNIESLANKVVGEDGLIGKAKKFGSSIVELANSGKKNINSIVIKLLVDTSAGGIFSSISTGIFEHYINELNVPAGKISDLHPFYSKLDKDGSFSLVVSYYYVNPFSFVNSKSMEYTIINRDIRMINMITIKPFVGKQGTSIKKQLSGTDTGAKEILVYIPGSAYDNPDKIKDKKYHKIPNCRNMIEENARLVKLSDAKASEVITGPCSHCFPDGEPTE